jgi:ABC-type multidrug transport system ATPase subunit
MIEINGLVMKYGDRVAINGVSFCVHEGEIFGLLGPNGAGKTTTISILATLFPHDGEQVTIAGYDLVRETSKIKPLIGFVPQELALYPTLSNWDNLAFFGRILGLFWIVSLMAGSVLQEKREGTFRRLLVRGYGLLEVLPKVGGLAAFAIVFFAIGVWQFRFE